MNEVVGGAEELSPAWLTAVLGAGGALSCGSVEEVRLEPAIMGGYSLLWPLRVRYSADAPTGSPTALLLKVPRPDIDAEQTASNGRCEHYFYTAIAPTAPGLPVPRCYGAAIEANGRRWHLLLEDLSGTHLDSSGYLPPPEPLCVDAVELLARVHAQWWGDPALRHFCSTIGELLDEERIARVTAFVRTAVAAFLDFLGDQIAPHRRSAYVRLAAVFPDVLRRLAAGPATLLHGDAHWRNFLYPRDRASQSTHIFDWQSCTVGPPAHDLAYMLARHWHPEPRRDLLERLLDSYHASLVSHGAANYRREQLQEDFMVGVVRQSVTPATNWFRWGRSGDHLQGPTEWSSRLERFLVPFDVLGWEDSLAALPETRS